MAYLPNYRKPEEEELRQRQDGFAPTGIQQAQQAAASAPSPYATGPAAPVAGGPTGFVNFGQYLNANRGAAQRTAEQLGQRVEGKGQQAQSGLAGLQSTFGQRVQAGSVQGPQQGTRVAQASPQGTTKAGQGGTQQYVSEGLQGTPQKSGPSASGTTWVSREEAQQGAHDRYVGPRGLSDLPEYQRLRESMSGAQSDVAALGRRHDTGVEALLMDEYGRRAGQDAYGAGMSAFDAGLVGNVGRRRFSELRKRYGGLGQAFADAEKAAAEQAKAAAASSEAASAAWGGLVRQADEEDEAARAAAQRAAYEAQPGGQKDLSGGQFSTRDPNTLSDEELNAMGYMHEPAPGESYAHFSDRVSGRKGA